MKALEINDVKGFMGRLLVSDTFDEYLILEAVITKANTFTIDGRLNEEYLPEFPSDTRLQTWGNVRNICFELVKGKVLPVYMKVVLQLPAAAAEQVLARFGAGISPDIIK